MHTHDHIDRIYHFVKDNETIFNEALEMYGTYKYMQNTDVSVLTKETEDRLRKQSFLQFLEYESSIAEAEYGRIFKSST